MTTVKINQKVLNNLWLYVNCYWLAIQDTVHYEKLKVSNKKDCSARLKCHENGALHCKKKVCGFPVPSRDVTNQTLPGQEYFNYSRTERVWLVTSRLGTGKSINFFYSV